MRIIPLFLVILIHLSSKSQGIFSDYFTGERLRYDYILAGNSKNIHVYDQDFIREPIWGGSKTNLTDTFRYGELWLEVTDSISGRILYSRGYSSLFKEWQMVDEAKSMERAFSESLILPFPGRTVEIEIYNRDSDSGFQSIHSVFFNPFLKSVINSNPPYGEDIRNLMITGPSDEKVDIAMIAEGYEVTQKDEFYRDAEKYRVKFFTWEPYRSYKDKFNFYAIFVPSGNSGTDIPGDSIWRNTAMNSSFYTFGNERYLTVSNMRTLREIASQVPYDQLCVLVNTDKYGGGGVFNSFTVFASKNEYSEFLFMHEFGHAFAALADEYYTSPTAYDDIIEIHIEPYQPNITTLIDFSSKWKDMIYDTIPLPTPNCKKYAGVVGVFEGAAYQAKGIYRPAYDCAMKSKACPEYCPVCRRAIERMILFYCK